MKVKILMSTRLKNPIVNSYFLYSMRSEGSNRSWLGESYGDDADTTRLWHMRLGHAGEKAMQGLVKQGLLKGAKTCKLEFCERKAD